jgi:hypothetical protein
MARSRRTAPTTKLHVRNASGRTVVRYEADHGDEAETFRVAMTAAVMAAWADEGPATVSISVPGIPKGDSTITVTVEQDTG